MKLRNGKEYFFKLTMKPIINIYKKDFCRICMQPYKKNDYICSCTITNINKHNFHKNCLLKSFAIATKYLINNNSVKICPYCYNEISDLKIVKLM